jgi:hypothetical protein
MKPIHIRTLANVVSILSATIVIGVVLWSQAASGVVQAGSDPSNRWSHIDRVESYSFVGKVLGDKDLSGIACVSPSRCLIGADEGREVQVVELSQEDRTLKVLKTVSLVSTGREIDIEAIACESDCYYIIGSHGLAKKTGTEQRNRYRIFRLKVDHTSGFPEDGQADLEQASLTEILKADPVLGKYFDKPLQHKGVNIEGLAIRDGTLFVGLRNPNLDGFAFVVEVLAADLFAGKGRPSYTLHKVQLGEGLGIREIVAAKSCFLIIAGNAGSEPSREYPKAQDYDKDRGFLMFAWDGDSTEAHRIGPIPDVPAKAEAMTILDESPDHITILVLFDGIAGGRPTVYRIH